MSQSDALWWDSAWIQYDDGCIDDYSSWVRGAVDNSWGGRLGSTAFSSQPTIDCASGASDLFNASDVEAPTVAVEGQESAFAESWDLHSDFSGWTRLNIDDCDNCGENISFSDHSDLESFPFLGNSFSNICLSSNVYGRLLNSDTNRCWDWRVWNFQSASWPGRFADQTLLPYSYDYRFDRSDGGIDAELLVSSGRSWDGSKEWIVIRWKNVNQYGGGHEHKRVSVDMALSGSGDIHIRVIGIEDMHEWSTADRIDRVPYVGFRGTTTYYSVPRFTLYPPHELPGVDGQLVSMNGSVLRVNLATDGCVADKSCGDVVADYPNCPSLIDDDSACGPCVAVATTTSMRTMMSTTTTTTTR